MSNSNEAKASRNEYNIAVIPGDGIGVEVTAAALKVMEKVAAKHEVKLNFTELLAGGCAIDKAGEPLPKETLAQCQKSDAVLLGAVGGPKWDNLSGDKRPEQALLGLRGGLGLYANLRPARIYDELKAASPLKDTIIEKGIDLLIVRELTGGIYFGEKGRTTVDGYAAAYDHEVYNEKEISRITRTAFEAARKRRRKVTLVDKANILESSRLWREVVNKIAKDYPDVAIDYLYVDNAAMQLVKNPAQFDVIVTSNMFGDILSDEASMITGSIGMLASASLGEGSLGMYEPIHGSAPDIAGQDLANPLAQILSAAMLFEYSLGMAEAARDIEKAVKSVLGQGYRTGDIWTEGFEKVGTKKMGELVLAEI
ncbi:MAG TPA: 3-isopropylmalate dehydrogenase [Methylomusa anaerophila]|uniref:3-isopropylmalate dehydrogenase n=1 Tax=Methylomusa anaerophila TaxID=1930071 RepID=A0A348AGU8_9FIRM|nr:3-isopropylmalate dehydrogenase [Methylomusa anaerophila]BBB90296.1 3-isopropylmalate dehydrogenase [Methylomusa anaerophila]HML89359.1 3-isopropylmalate dehydrogenase [Methylomusa anaerophila]